ncbi:hypothetical protein ACFUMH_07335 [Cellulomonas sp. NPDC057328]|uniref:hypothetical protein n=1 Tax=Cellulomonas sp. NPDC057328 TaxID=3346101 RepID=UPI0036417083
MPAHRLAPRPARRPERTRRLAAVAAALTAVVLAGTPAVAAVPHGTSTAAATAAPTAPTPAPTGTADPAATPAPPAAPNPAATPAATPAPTASSPAGPGALPDPLADRSLDGAVDGTTDAPATDATTDATASRLVARGTTMLGQYVSRGDRPSTEAATQVAEDRLDRRLDAQRVYVRWDEELRGPGTSATVERGRVPMLSVLPRRGDGSVVRWSTIASGGVDERIRSHARQVKQLGPAVYLTLHHEPDIAGSAWGTPAEYVAAWRHYLEVFRDEGVTTVLWTWLPSAGALTKPNSDPTAKGFYPGDDVVDRVGSAIYNWFGCREGSTTQWRPLERVASGLRTFAANHGKPVVLAEWGSVEDPQQPGRRAQWLRDAFAYFSTWTDLEVVSYFDTAGTCDWRLGSGGAADAYRELAAAPELRPRPSAWLEASRTQGAGSLTVELSGDRSAGARSATGRGVQSWSLDLGDGTRRSGTGRPPASLTHTYGVGTFTPTLRVTDSGGRTATDVRTVAVAAAPVVTGVQERDVTTTAADLYAWVDTRGVAGSVRFQWFAGSTRVGSSTLQAVAKDGPQEIRTIRPRGLRPGTAYRWTVTVTTKAGSATREDSWVAPGPPTVRPVGPASVSATSADLKLRVHPNGVATTAWIEWGQSSTGRRTPTLSLGGAGYERGEEQTVSGLSRRTTYRYRVVAENAHGRTVGPVQTFTTGG